MTRPLHVTDHAVLRYMARAQGVDVEAIRREIERRVRKGLDRLDAMPGLQDVASGVQSEGMTFRIEGGVVVTCMATSRPERGHG